MKAKILGIITMLLLFAFIAVIIFLLINITANPALYDFFSYQFRTGSRFELYLYLYGSGALALWILTELILVLYTLRGDPFVLRNAAAFVRMGAAAEAAMLLFAYKSFMSPSGMTYIIACVTGLAGLFAFTLAEVFRKAVGYKQENDLTI